MPRERPPRAAKPLTWAAMGKGLVGKGLLRVWRAVRARRPHRQQQNMPMPFGSLSSSALLHSQHQEAATGQVDWPRSNQPLFLLPQLPPLPPWLVAGLPTLAGAGAAQQQQQLVVSAAAAPPTSVEAEAVDAGPLEHMLNPAHTFSMTLTPLGPEPEQQQQQQQQQALLTVGSRHWGVRGLLSVRLYDFACYANISQAQAVLPALTLPSSSMQGATAASHQQQQQQQQQPPQAHQHLHKQQQQLRWGGGWLSELVAALQPQPWAPTQLEQRQQGAGGPAAAASSTQQQPQSTGELLPVLRQMSRREARQRAKHARRQSLQARRQERRAAKKQATAAKAAARRAVQQQGGQAAAPDLAALVKAGASGVGMSLVLKAAREVPLHLLADEYEKVLARRLARVGGGPTDAAALQTLLSAFSRPEALPAAVRAGSGGSSVARGAMIVFERGADGSVVARVGRVVLASIPASPRLAEALFDLYLGDPPTSSSARDAAVATLGRISAAKAAAQADAEAAASGGEGEGRQQAQQLALAHHCLPAGRQQTISCNGRPALRGGGGGSEASGLALQDLAACTLHMG